MRIPAWWLPCALALAACNKSAPVVSLDPDGGGSSEQDGGAPPDDLDGGDDPGTGGVAKVRGFECGGELFGPTGFEPKGITTLSGGAGPDRIVVLYDDGNETLVQVFDADSGQVVASKSYNQNQGGGVARAIHGFEYELGGSGARPMLAVATSKTSDALHIHLYDWDPIAGTLTDHDGPQGAGPISEPCFTWACGSEAPCTSQASCGADNEVCTQQWACEDGVPCNESRCQLQSGAQSRCTGPADCTRPGQECINDVCMEPPIASGTCPSTAFPNGPADPPPTLCACKIKVEFGTEVSMITRDVDADGKSDLAIASSSDLPLVIYRSSLSGASFSGPGNPAYRAQGCSCGRFAQAPSAFALLNFGGKVDGLPEPAAPGSIDLVIGAAGGNFVRYATRRPDLDVRLSCGAPNRFGELLPVRDIQRGRFGCNVSTNPGCAPFEDAVIVSAKSLGGGSFDDPGTIRVVFGNSRDVSEEDPPTGIRELLPRTLSSRAPPKDPRAASVTDFNADGNDDLAVLFGSSFEVHVWHGNGHTGFAYARDGARLDVCPAVQAGTSDCNPHRRFATPDLNDDGRADLAVLCDSNASNARVRWFRTLP